MTGNRDDDREHSKKSWREIDQMREKSGGRREGGSGGGGSSERLQRSAAYRTYKTALNELFDGKRELAPELKSKLQADAVAVSAKTRRQAVDAIVNATMPKDVMAAYQAYHAQYGFPEQEEALSKLLDMSDMAIVLEAIHTIGRLRAGGVLKRGASLKARIKTAQMTFDDPELQQAAQAVLAVL